LGLGGSSAFLYTVPGEPELHYPGMMAVVVLACTFLDALGGTVRMCNARGTSSGFAGVV
jgi:hypothetical protein